MNLNFLNIDELYGSLRRQRQEQLAVFNSILKHCHDEIRRASIEGQQLECQLDIPYFVLGKSPYKFGDLLQFLIRQLQNNGLAVRSIGENRIHISWSPEDINYDQYTQKLGEYQRYQRLLQLQEQRNNQRIKQELQRFSPLSGPNQVALITTNKDDVFPVNRKKLTKN